MEGAKGASSAASQAATAVRWRAMVVLLFASGALGLALETIWMRAFTLRFGAGAPAAAATISALFTGLALGSAWFGRRAPLWRRPLRATALLIAGTGLAAALEPAFESALSRLPALPPLLVAFVVLLPASFLMGGTLPAAFQVLDDGRSAAGPACGTLYTANTFGAIVGALAVPFAALPALGVKRTYALLVGASLVLGGLAWALDRGRGAERPAAARAAGAASGEPIPSRPGLSALAFLSGLTLLGLEVVWMRMLAQVHPSSLQAFALVLALFLAALAAGAALGTARVRATAPGSARSPSAWLAGSWIVSALLTLLAPLAFFRMTHGLEFLTGSRGDLGALALACGLSFAPATVAAGVALPLIMAEGAQAGGAAAPIIGRLLAANTFGSVAGPLLTTFALFSLVGLWGSVVAFGLAQLATGIVLCLSRRSTRRAWTALLALVPAVLLSRAAVALPRVHLDADRGEELVWVREGSHGIATALRERGHLRLKLDNSYTLGGTGTAGDERLLGHIPLLLSPSPRRVAFLGLGTGITASAALRHPVERVVAFELVPEVAEGARTVFAEANLHLLEDPRVVLVVDDARTHLDASRAAFEVIVGDLVVPWRRGEAQLLTREHFVRARAALAPGGLYCQWLPAFQMSEEELRIVVATFLDVFPEALLWRGDFVASQPALGLIGNADGHSSLDVAAIDARVRARRSELRSDSRYLSHPAGLWLYCVGALDPLAAWVQSARRNTQDQPWLELLGARAPLAVRPASAFLGLDLLDFFAEVRRRPSRILATLDPDHRRWQEAGERLFRASTLDSLGKEAAARELALDALGELPEEVRAGLFGSDPGVENR